MTYTIVKPDEGEQLDALGDRMRVFATTDQTDNALAAIEVTVSPGNGAPPHANSREALGWYVLEGTLQFITDSGAFDLDAGGWFYVPKGVPHTFHNATDEPVRALMLAVPGGVESFFREIGRELGSDEAPRPPTDEGFALVMETAPRYGIDIPPATCVDAWSAPLAGRCSSASVRWPAQGESTPIVVNGVLRGGGIAAPPEF